MFICVGSLEIVADFVGRLGSGNAFIGVLCYLSCLREDRSILDFFESARILKPLS